jgi:hypothetical protein
MIGQGVAVSQDGNVVVITTQGLEPSRGKGGIASVYRLQPNEEWRLEQQLWPSDADISVTLGERDPLTAASVAITPMGNLIMVGVPDHRKGQGASWLFEYQMEETMGKKSLSWVQVATLIGTDSLPGDRQGGSVAISDDGLHMAHGAPAARETRGIVWVWRWNHTKHQWIQDPVLVNPADAMYPSAFGKSLLFTISDVFSLGIRTQLIVGAPLADTVEETPIPHASPNGQVHVLEWNEKVGQWLPTEFSPIQNLKDSEGASSFGTSLAVSAHGRALAAGGPLDAGSRGAVWILDLWTGHPFGSKITLQGVKSNPYTRFGTTVAWNVLATRLAIGSPYESIGIGGFHTFEWDQNAPQMWRHTQYSRSTDIYLHDPCQGTALAMSRDGSTVVMGAYENKWYSGGAWIFRSD